jgi:hypothetical protein
MFRMLATAVSIGKFLTFAPFLAIIPAVWFALDRWMIYEANINYQNVSDIPAFTKITMMLPAVAIWTTLVMVLTR